MLRVFINWVCATIFSLIGFACYKSRKPVGFWSGQSVRKDEVVDVRKYNIANSVLWSGYSVIYWIAGFASFVDEGLGMIFTIFGCTAGIVYLILGYHWIKKRFFVSYRDKYIAGKLNDYK